MKNIFNNNAFRDGWLRAQQENPDVTLQDYILTVNGQESEELLTESREDARLRRKLERRAAREDLEASNDPFIRKVMARRKANPLPEKREGTYFSFKIAGSSNAYFNSEKRLITNSLTNISLC